MHFGASGSGKSTLKEAEVRDWIHRYPQPRVLIVDSKPRFKAQWELNGTRATRRYKKWTRGAALPDSVLLPLDNPRAELRQAWRLGFPIVVAQADHRSLSSLGSVELGKLYTTIGAFYSDADDRYSQLLDVDELSDFYSSSGYAARGDHILRVMRSGRELNMSFTAAAQRPRGLPYSFVTELSHLIVFRLQYAKDNKHLAEMGYPEAVTIPTRNHEFVRVDLLHGAAGRYQLAF